jgi:hypothetical protein
MPSEMKPTMLVGAMHGKCGNPICFNDGNIVNVWDKVRKMHICFICELIEATDETSDEQTEKSS